MTQTLSATVVYLLAFPFTARVGERAAPPALTKSAPYFQPLDIEVSELSQTSFSVGGQTVSVRRQAIDEQVQSVECRYTLSDVLAPANNAQRLAMQAELREHVLREAGYSGPFIEEYFVLCLTHVAPAPDAFVDAHRSQLASLLRSELRALSEMEIEQILSSRAHYAKEDLTVVDWEGAIIIDPEADFQSEIELLKLGNYQILRYRLLDRAIERTLENLRQELESRRRFSLGGKAVREALDRRLELLLDFEKSEQLLLLIGDWYTAQLYRLIVDEFYIDDWKTAVHDKLDQLESITDTVRENFSITWQQFLDLLQLAGWLLLLVGYFVLFYLDVAAVGK
jgi:hypothetical protein